VDADNELVSDRRGFSQEVEVAKVAQIEAAVAPSAPPTRH
jgi:hypothetical protein